MTGTRAGERAALADEIERLANEITTASFPHDQVLREQLGRLMVANRATLLTALRADAPAETMRERAAKVCDGDAATFFEAARQWREAPSSPGYSLAHPSEFAGVALEAAARTIRALPLTPTEDGRDGL